MIYTEREHQDDIKWKLAHQKRELSKWYSELILGRVQEAVIRGVIKAYIAFALGMLTAVVLTIIILATMV